MNNEKFNHVLTLMDINNKGPFTFIVAIRNGGTLLHQLKKVSSWLIMKLINSNINGLLKNEIPTTSLNIKAVAFTPERSVSPPKFPTSLLIPICQFPFVERYVSRVSGLMQWWSFSKPRKEKIWPAGSNAQLSRCQSELEQLQSLSLICSHSFVKSSQKLTDIIGDWEDIMASKLELGPERRHNNVFVKFVDSEQETVCWRTISFECWLIWDISDQMSFLLPLDFTLPLLISLKLSHTKILVISGTIN